MHDIEDLKVAGKRKQGCPYFAARAMAETAELVFCPYNYIVDPIIRESVKVDLKVRLRALSIGCDCMHMPLVNRTPPADDMSCVCKCCGWWPNFKRQQLVDVQGAVVIFDEAHNIEDIARESGSCDIKLRDLHDASNDIKRAVTRHLTALVFPSIRYLCSHLRAGNMRTLRQSLRTPPLARLC